MILSETYITQLCLLLIYDRKCFVLSYRSKWYSNRKGDFDHDVINHEEHVKNVTCLVEIMVAIVI